MGTNDIQLKICDSALAAPDYKKLPEFKLASLDKAIIVRNGTGHGNDTVDLQFHDPETGQKYVAMVTARLLKQVAEITITDRH